MIRYWVAKVHKLSNTTKHSGDYRTKIISSGEMSENRPLTGDPAAWATDHSKDGLAPTTRGPTFTTNAGPLASNS